jgi:hypothetical protein
VTAQQLSNIIAMWSIWLCAAILVGVIVYHAWKQR